MELLMPKSPVAGVAGSIRVKRLSLVGLVAAEAHGNRKDTKGKARAIYPNAPPISTTGLNLSSLFDQHVQDAFRPNSSKICLHVLAQFPTELVPTDEAGRVSDDHARWMLSQALDFARDVFGPDAVFADRIDRDERGQHVVDLFIAPKYQKKTRGGSKTAVSISRHLKELAFRTGRWVVPENLDELIRAVPPGPNAVKERAKLRSLRDHPTLRSQGQALQDAWFVFLDQKAQLAGVKRGSPKKTAGDDAISAEELDMVRRQEALAEREQAIERERHELENEWEQMRNSLKFVRDATVALKSYDYVFEATIKGHLLVSGGTGSSARWEWRGPGQLPEDIKAGGKKAWELTKALSERLAQVIDEQVTPQKVAAAVEARVTNEAIERKTAQLASQKVTAEHIRAAANDKVTHNDIDRAIAARVTDDSIKAAAAKRVTTEMIVNEARKQVTEVHRKEAAQALITDAERKAAAREQVTKADIAKEAARQVTEEEKQAQIAIQIEPLKKAAVNDHAAAKQLKEEAELAQRKAASFQACIEAWLAGDIVDALITDEGKKSVTFRDNKAMERWAEQVRLAFELVWNFVRRMAVEVKKAVRDRVTPESVREAAAGLVTDADRIAAAAKLVSDDDKRKAALGLLDGDLLLRLAKAKTEEQIPLAARAVSAAQQQSGMSAEALKALRDRKGPGR
jgi:hypothetical protein